MAVNRATEPRQGVLADRAEAFRDLQGSTDYRVYRTGRGTTKYTVTAPGGEVIAVRGTLRGARKAIEGHRHEEDQGGPAKWWQYPIVETARAHPRRRTFTPPAEHTQPIPTGVGHMGTLSSRDQDELEALQVDLEAREELAAMQGVRPARGTAMVLCGAAGPRSTRCRLTTHLPFVQHDNGWDQWYDENAGMI